MERRDDHQQLRCHHCGATQEPPRQCAGCQSYKLFPVGTGTAQIEKDIKRLVPEARVLRIDRDVVKTEKELERRLTTFKNKEVDILVGTQQIIKERLLSEVSLTVILGAENFFVFPAFDAAERVFRLFEILRRKTSEKVVIQTLNSDLPFLQFFIRREYEKLLDGELEERKLYNYPPFGELIKLTFAHRLRSHAEYEAHRLAHELQAISHKLQANQLLGPSPAFVPKERGRWKFVLLLKLANSVNPDARTALLMHTPPGWQVEINPRELL